MLIQSLRDKCERLEREAKNLERENSELKQQRIADFERIYNGILDICVKRDSPNLDKVNNILKFLEKEGAKVC